MAKQTKGTKTNVENAKHSDSIISDIEKEASFSAFKGVSDALFLSLNDAMSSKFEKDLSVHAEEIADMAKNSKPLKSNGIHQTVNDTYSNNLLNISTNENDTGHGSNMFDQYSLSNSTLNWALWIALYNDSWVFKKAIDKPAEDEINAGVSFHNKANVTDVYEEYNSLTPYVIQLLKWGALFGGSVAVCMFKGLKDADYEKPIDYAKIKPNTVMSMYVTDRWYGCAQEGFAKVKNMADPDFGKPMYYSIMFANGKTLKVHHSYVLRYEHRDAPRFMKNGMLQGWGYAEGSHILNELTQNDKLKTSIQSLVDKALIEVIKMPGMRGIFMGTDKQNESQLRKRLEMVVWGRNYNSLTFLDKDDEYSQNTFGGLSGLADLLEQNRWQIAAALDMVGILYGDMKNGMGSDTQAMPTYNRTILNRSNAWVRPPLQKLFTILFKKHGIVEKPKFTFNEVFKDLADTSKIDMLSKYSSLLRSLTADGIISKDQYAEAFQNYMNNGAIAISFTKAEQQSIKEKDENESEPNADETFVPSTLEEEPLTSTESVEPAEPATTSEMEMSNPEES